MDEINVIFMGSMSIISET
jgi:hypothetical protein